MLVLGKFINVILYFVALFFNFNYLLHVALDFRKILTPTAQAPIKWPKLEKVVF